MLLPLPITGLDIAKQGSDQASAAERVAGLEAALAHLEHQIASCGEDPLLPRCGPPTLGGVQLAFRRGSLSCILGPVGCGKSTLLYAALNEVPVEAGRVALAGKVCPPPTPTATGARV